MPVLNTNPSRRQVLMALSGLAILAPALGSPQRARAKQNGMVMPDGRLYTAYVPAATKAGQFYQYTCEFDASWVILMTFGYDVPFEEQLAIVGYDTSIEPYYVETADGFIIYGGDITTAYSGDYTSNLLTRATGSAMLPLFQEYGFDAAPVRTREAIEETLDRGGLIWTKATVDFLPWEPVKWITPQGKELPGVLGNDHAVVVMGYNGDGVVIRDVLGPTDTNWERPYEYDVPWETFLSVFEAQGFDGIGVFPADADETSDPIGPAYSIQPADPLQICC